MRRPLVIALAALGLAACEKTQTQATPSTQDGQLTPVGDPHADGVTPLPDPELQNGRVGRSARRLTVTQLGTSIQTAVGRPWSKLDGLATSLGRADYALVNTESIEANLVFAKFLEDGAREVCLAQGTAELKLTTPTDRVLTRTLPAGAPGDLRKLTDAQVRDMLVYLSTRFWGSPLEGDELTRWVGFVTQAAATAEPLGRRDQALAAVCINLMTDSRFLTY